MPLLRNTNFREMNSFLGSRFLGKRIMGKMENHPPRSIAGGLRISSVLYKKETPSELRAACKIFGEQIRRDRLLLQPIDQLLRLGHRSDVDQGRPKGCCHRIVHQGYK